MSTRLDAAPLQATAPPRRLSPQMLTGYLFILPALIGFAVFYLYPALRGIQISFTDWNLLSEPKGVGMANYQEVIRDPNSGQHWASP
jgi:multiple sugar transport system permease protein